MIHDTGDTGFHGDEPIEVHLNTRGCLPMQPGTAEALARMFKAVHEQFWNDHDPLCFGLCCMADGGPIRDEEPPRLEELYRDHGGEAGSA